MRCVLPAHSEDLMMFFHKVTLLQRPVLCVQIASEMQNLSRSPAGTWQGNAVLDASC